ncbi:hypothetical protein AB0P21_36860 [Kribbella sp. NPDC056861]|uniref:hypothetical protein n=1 Tax=Kribbella sp. NPDC056861 TaxID=3154857 RepID=UPI00341C2C6B
MINWPSWVVIGASVILLVAAAVWRSSAGNDFISSRSQVTPEVQTFNGSLTTASTTESESQPTREISGVRLPSASPEYYFELSATIGWSERSATGRYADAGSIAVDAVLTRARAVSALHAPSDEGWVSWRLAALLGEPDLDETGRLHVWATGVKLRLPTEDRQHLRSIVEVGQREQTARLERRLELETRAYLKDDVFATVGSAASWWLARNPGQVEKCVGLLGDLRQLSNAANGKMSIDEELESISSQDAAHHGRPVIFASTDTPPTQPLPAFDFDGAVAKLLEGHDEPERSLKADYLANLEARFNRPSQAQRIRELHDVDPITPTPSPQPPTNEPLTTPNPAHKRVNAEDRTYSPVTTQISTSEPASTEHVGTTYGNAEVLGNAPEADQPTDDQLMDDQPTDDQTGSDLPAANRAASDRPAPGRAEPASAALATSTSTPLAASAPQISGTVTATGTENSDGVTPNKNSQQPSIADEPSAQTYREKFSSE